MNLKSLIQFFGFIFLIFSTNFVLADQCKLDGLSDLSTDPPFDSYDGAVQVSMHPVFVKLGPVDGENYKFYADFYLNAYWYDEDLADQIYENSPNDWCQLDGASVAGKIWTPGIEFINIVEMQDSLIDKIYVSVDGSVHRERRIQGSFTADLNFSQFPFDQQILNVKTVPFQPDGSVVLNGVEPFGEWSQNLKFSDWNMTKTEGVEGSVDYLGDTYPTYDFQITLERIANFYLIKVIIPVLVMVLLACGAFLISPADFDARLGLTVTLLLTVVAYTFIAGENLPVLSYLTFTDVFLVLSFLVCVISVIFTIIFRLKVGVEYDDEDTITLEMHKMSKMTGYLILALYLGATGLLYFMI